MITPYNKQMQKISGLLKGQDLPGVRGRIDRALPRAGATCDMISTVRSSPDFIGFDAKHNLSFLDNPKRFNVAIARVLAHDHRRESRCPDERPALRAALLRMCIDKEVRILAISRRLQGGDDGGDGDGDELLADRLEDIMTDGVEVSQLVQQEGNEMPSWERIDAVDWSVWRGVSPEYSSYLSCTAKDANRCVYCFQISSSHHRRVPRPMQRV